MSTTILVGLVAYGIGRFYRYSSPEAANMRNVKASLSILAEDISLARSRGDHKMHIDKYQQMTQIAKEHFIPIHVVDRMIATENRYMPKLA